MEDYFDITRLTVGQRLSTATLPAGPHRLEGRRGTWGPDLTPARPVWAEQAQGVKVVRARASSALFRKVGFIDLCLTRSQLCRWSRTDVGERWRW